MKKIIYLFAVIAILIACTKDHVDAGSSKRELTTLQTYNIFYDRATLQGECNITDATITEQGFELSTSPIDNNNPGTKYTVTTPTNGKFALVVNELEKNTRYYLRAYVSKNNGQTLIGNNIAFSTESVVIDPPSAPLGHPSVIDAKTVEIMGEIESMGTGKLTEEDAKRVEVKLANVGIYYWRSDDPHGRDNAHKFIVEEEEANLLSTTSDIVFKVTDLSPATTYKYILYIKTGAYFYGDKWVSYSEEVESESEGEFTTDDLEAPQVTTIGCEDVTPTSVVAKGKLISNGGDPDTEFGIEYRKEGEASFSNIAVANGLSDSGDNMFSVFIKGLSANTKYHCRAFAKNEKDRVIDNTEYSFTTDQSGKPYVDSYPNFNYDYRVANFTSTSVVIRAKLLSDGGTTLTSKGFYWGKTPEEVDSKTFTVDVETIKTDGVYDYFEATLEVPEGVVYYKPFAINSSGETIFNTMLQVSTAIGGGNSWVYMYDISTSAGAEKDKYMYNRMSLDFPNCVPLTYYELDPIVKGDKTYYLLDRNLNALNPYKPEDIGTSVVASTAGAGTPIRNSIGAYYQWGYEIPSVTAELPLKNNLTDWGYKAAPAMLNMTSWPVNPCPKGYDLPTKEDFDNMIDVARGSNPNGNLSVVYDKMRLGPTAYANNTGGVQTNKDQNLTWNSDATHWIKEASSGTASSVYRISRTTGTGATVTYQDTAFPRINCVAVRCVRVVQQ